MLNSLRLRLTLIFIGLAVGPLILVGAIIGQRGFTSVEQQSLALQHEITARVGSEIRAFIEERKSELVLLDEVRGLGIRDLKEQRAILSNLLLYEHVYQEVALLNSEGQEQIRLSRSGVVMDEDLESRAGKEEFLFPTTYGEPYFSPVRFDEAIREPLLTISVPLVDLRSGQIASVLVADLRFKTIWDLLANIDLPIEGDVYVIDQAGRIVAHRNPAIVLRGTTIDLPEVDGRAEGSSGTDVIVARDMLQFGDQELVVVAEQPASSALELATNSLRVAVVATSTALALAIVLVVLTARQIVRPIEALATSARAISGGDFSQQVAIPPLHDEIADLARSFNFMARALQEREETLQAQNVALQAEITERKWAEEALRVSEERFALAVRGSNAGLWDWDILNNSLYWSPRLKELLGYADDELDVDFDTFESHLHPDDREHTGAAIEAHLKDRGLYEVEQRLCTKSGEYRWFRARGQALWDEAGNPVRMVGSITDTTERKRAEEALRESERRYRLLAENAKDVIWTVDMNMRPTYMSPSITRLLGYSVEEAMAKPMEAVYTPASFGTAMKVLAEELAIENMEQKDLFRSWTLELELNRKDGSILPVEVKFSFIREPDGRPVKILAIARDITERKRAEEALKEYSEQLEEMVEERTKELRDAQARLIQSEKLAATGRLAVSVAHEINNPLQGISNYLSLISQQVAEEDPLHENLDMVKLGFERIAEIVRRLRAFHRPVGEGMESTEINGVVERALALVGHQLSLGNVAVKTDLAERELLVLGSAGQLEQVLVNLALNAQEAMPGGGVLMVRTTLREGMVQLQVSDTGHGISEEEMSKLFKPFYSGEGGRGLGLGLWISHNIIEGHGGHIEVESQVGQGTTFTVSLPAYQGER